MSVPDPRQRVGEPGRRGRAAEARSAVANLPPLVLVLGAVALAALLVCGLGLAFLLFRGARGGPQEVVGSALPPGWQPGEGSGVGQLPPTPAVAAARNPVGAAPAVPPADPYPGPTPDPMLEGELPPDGSAIAPPYGDEPPPPPEETAAADFEPPRLLYLPNPEYPPMARRMGREGTVELQVRVDQVGRVRAANPVGDRLGMGLEQAARRAALGAHFAPARANGEPVESETRIAIRFRLR
jgi:periplasmic protein TonB